MCDRFGRKKLFVITLVLYIVSTVVTAFSFAPWFFFLARFFTGAGIGGEYSAINSAIDELIPARARGRIDLAINGSYWLGSIIGSGFALFFLGSVFPADLGWRLAFGVGAVLGLAVMFVRRKVPESPRWLFIHGREDDAEAIVDSVEEEIKGETGQDLDPVSKSITVRQRKSIPFRELAAVAFKLYPKRAVLCIALFIGQAFIYNGVTFNLGTLMTTFYQVGASAVPIFIIIYAIGNLAGPLVLGRLFDTVGRKPMISGTYLGSAVLAVVLAGLFVSGSLNSVTFILVVVAVFFLASSGASAAYLTASEIFPMETRALAIAFFYAVGTAIGGITGPLLFGKLIASGSKGEVAVAFLIGAAVMALGGLAEVFLGVKAEGKQLEDIAKPLTVADASGNGDSDDDVGNGDADQQDAAAGDAGNEPDPEADQAHERDRARSQARLARERSRRRRFRPGPGSVSSSRGWPVTTALGEPPTLENEIQAIRQALTEHGPTERTALGQLVGSRYWGPGTFGRALRTAVADGQIRRVSRGLFAIPDSEPGALGRSNPDTACSPTDHSDGEPPRPAPRG